MKTLNYGGREMTVEALLDLANTLDKEAKDKRWFAVNSFNAVTCNSYEQQATDRENETRAIRAFVERSESK